MSGDVSCVLPDAETNYISLIMSSQLAGIESSTPLNPDTLNPDKVVENRRMNGWLCYFMHVCC